MVKVYRIRFHGLYQGNRTLSLSLSLSLALSLSRFKNTPKQTRTSLQIVPHTVPISESIKDLDAKIIASCRLPAGIYKENLKTLLLNALNVIVNAFERRGSSDTSRKKRWEHVLRMNIPSKNQDIDMAVCLGWCYYGFSCVSKEMKDRLEILWSVFDEMYPGSRTRIRAEFASLVSSIDMLLLKRAMDVVFVAMHIVSNSNTSFDGSGNVVLLLNAFETVVRHAEQVETKLLEISNRTSESICSTILTILKSSTSAVSRFNSIDGNLRVLKIVARNFRRLPDIVVPVLLIVRLSLCASPKVKGNLTHALSYAKEFNLRDLLLTLTREIGNGFEEDLHRAAAKLLRLFVNGPYHIRNHLRVNGASNYERCVGILSILAVNRPSHDIVLREALPTLAQSISNGTMDAHCVGSTLRIVEVLLAPFKSTSVRRLSFLHYSYEYHHFYIHTLTHSLT